MDTFRRMTGTSPATITERKLREARAELQKKGNYIKSVKTRMPALNKAEKDKLTQNYAETNIKIKSLETQHQANIMQAIRNKEQKKKNTAAAALLPKKSLTNSIFGRTTATAARKRNYNCTCTQKQGGKRRYKRRLTRRKSRRN